MLRASTYSDILPQSKVAEDISETVSPDYASSLNVVYFPQLGYLICIPLLEEWKTGDGIVVMEGWTFQVRSISHSSPSVSPVDTVPFSSRQSQYIYLVHSSTEGLTSV